MRYKIAEAVCNNLCQQTVEAPAGNAPGLAISSSEQLPLWDSHGPDLIKYRIEYVNVGSDSKKSFEGNKGEPDGLARDKEPPVFEYVEVRVTDDPIKAENSEKDTSTQYHTKHRGHAYLRILSPAVSEALRCVVDYYPGIDLSKHVIDVPEPFAIFVFFEQQLNEYRERLKHRADDVTSSCINRYAYKHVGIVQDFVRQKVSKAVEAERERHARGYATFDMLWLLYKPGSEVYYDFYEVGEHDPYIVENVLFGLINGTTSEFRIAHWNLGANDVVVGPSEFNFRTIKRFAGEKAIVSMDTYPCEYLKFTEGLDGGEVSKIRDHFIARGKKWYTMRQKPKCHQFDGHTTSYPRRKVTITSDLSE